MKAKGKRAPASATPPARDYSLEAADRWLQNQGFGIDWNNSPYIYSPETGEISVREESTSEKVRDKAPRPKGRF